jgi:zinc D-Ala-D-Ala carboxypeptidase
MNWNNYPNFDKTEFDCKHTGLNEMKPEFMEVLQRIRTEYNKPMKITSGYRHPTHPVEARKLHSKGEHTQGMCADILCTENRRRMELVKLALKHGITRIGIAETFLHLGLGGNNLPSDVIWFYK